MQKKESLTVLWDQRLGIYLFICSGFFSLGGGSDTYTYIRWAFGMLAVFETTFILILFFQKLHELCLTGRSCRARVGQAKQARQVKSQCFSDVVNCPQSCRE
ncbi:hypothetical protein M438DRAFT_10012 [Aureobasidium pullulans EXF-150]|uniref:Uncharacterized protein n=1 Tax=Aureobasidium pullulans EXF-150 TaxID=1043002 RepID=A0A074Y110_AURPU|nr:uncharacterized protein M438DRAFT_10012 [Aureobasidium pullulans EXF-150]KEQ89589.1 hypothetical protein M438DRAFT_10012 [Aureobasidium pullulans EXF-150]